MKLIIDGETIDAWRGMPCSKCNNLYWNFEIDVSYPRRLDSFFWTEVFAAQHCCPYCKTMMTDLGCAELPTKYVKAFLAEEYKTADETKKEIIMVAVLGNKNA